ncbi:50S ribosomal protein L25/general stress protein Ctc [Marinomonas atlantica]|uniref:50S ribosomal protein L25/general stress protein Ctc n=1 Tax=Marinomonas atlantica TaxID=1806668 RepID=UPI000836675C|nr:50S ribosomal protein L25/general stress protein Ctc [Marinomonas atlantica]MCO4784699.1 50S ribosomal protein L25/general stress protein Ctc [Marinomonas atlantica]
MSVVLNASVRNEEGKGASRRLRLQGLVPAVVYGGNTNPESVSFKGNEVVKAVKDAAFLTSVVKVSVDGAEQEVIVKSLQRHPATGDVMHIDLLRVDSETKIVTRVPLNFVNAAKSEGVKSQGGRLQVEAKLAEVRCLPKDLPAALNVDAINGQLGQIFHLSDAELPEGVELVALLKGEDHDQPIARIGKAKR